MGLLILISGVLIVWTVFLSVETSFYHRRINRYREEKKELIDWLSEVPEFYGIDEEMWEPEMKRFRRRFEDLGE